MAPEPPSPAASSVLLPLLRNRSRRGSLASLSSTKAEIDSGALAQALDTIHSTAKQSETFTSFHDYDGGPSRSGPSEFVSSGISGFYDKYIRGIGNGSPVTRPRSSASKRSDEMSRTSNKAPKTTDRVSSAADATSTKSKISPTAADATETVREELRTPTKPSKSKDESIHRHRIDDQRRSTKADSRMDDRARHEDAKDHARDGPATTGNENPRLSSEDDDRAETAAQSLARVLSHHGSSVPGKSSREPSLHSSSEPTANDPAPGMQRSGSLSASLSGAAIRFADPTHVKSARSSEQRPPMALVGVSHLPGFDPSKEVSTDGGDTASISSSKPSHIKSVLAPSPNLNYALQRQRFHDQPHLPLQSADQVPKHLKRRVISKAFWMKDENAKDCFYCGESFSTFRRKHHCRTCGQIFDAKCTSLVPGRPFGQPGTMRLCKPCEAMIYGSDDDSTVVSDDASEYRRTPMSRRMTTTEDDDLTRHIESASDKDDDVVDVATPSIGIPASRRNREAKRRSAVIEFDAPPPLPRPLSSHSLISLSRRPRSSSHRRQNSRHHQIRGFRGAAEERVPFQSTPMVESIDSGVLPAFHNDNIIDPDLAPFASDEGSEGEERPNILGAVSDAKDGSREKQERSGSLNSESAAKNGRARTQSSSSMKAIQNGSAQDPGLSQLMKASRNRNTSFGGLAFSQASPRRSRSNNLLKQTLEPTAFDHRSTSPSILSMSHSTRLVRSSDMRGRSAPPVELSRASLEHVRRLLSQMLEDNGIAHKLAWQKALVPMLLRCTDDVEPNVQAGDDMDVRHYIKFKKVSGGSPGDTSYISGIVFTKNIALKSMARLISRPRIAIITFAIEYARHQTHFMSLEPVIAQEQEYLKNLVGRISALRPQVLLVQRNVSGTALRLLEKAGITVAFNIKESVLAAVARLTQTTMIKSVDKLTMDPSHLGVCDSFEVKTYVHDGSRKSYIFVSGCEPDLGCTVVLRGSDTKMLRKIKRITEFMCYVAYNLKLETSLMRDEFVSIPLSAPGQMEAPDADQRKAMHYSIDLASEDGRNGIEYSDPQDDDETLSRYETLEARSRTRILSASPFVVFMQPLFLTQLRDSERRLKAYKLLRDQYAAADANEGPETTDDHHFEIVKPEMIHVPASRDQSKAVRDYLHAVHEAQLDKTTHTFETQKRLMESFMGGGIDPFDPLSHQTIVVLQSTISTITSAPCVGPELLGIGFYAGFNRVEPQFEEDCTLGQYVEDQCLSAHTACKECSKRMYDHHRQYVHGYGRLSISVKRQAAKMRGYQRTILMWATCRICKQETTVTPMSNNTWRYSFAKYLESSFWSSPLHPRAGVCEHDIHKDFMRCFGFEELVVCVQYDPVEIYDVIVPRATITWKVESDLGVKNGQFSHFVQRLNAFTDSIKKRLDSINIDVLDEKKAIEALELLDQLRHKAKDEHNELLQKLQQRYAQSRYYELIPLNRALRLMDEKAIAWDDIFGDFERDYFPSETDIRKLATLQLRNMFLESQPAHNTVAIEGSDSEDSTGEGDTAPRRLKRGITAPAWPSEKVQDVLSSTVEEHRQAVAALDDASLLNGDPATQTNEGDPAHRTSQGTREQYEQAIERNEVKHLDLAVPCQSPDIVPEQELLPGGLTEYESRPSTQDSQDKGEPFATQPKNVGTGLMERIEQIRNTQIGTIADLETSNSKIPRPIGLRKPDASPQPEPPPLLRAQSSPSSPRHAHQNSGDTEHSIDAIANSNVPLDKQLNEKHHEDRLGVSRLASKVSKLTPSLIPRSIPVHPDDRNSTRVSALAKHFEQMSKEFERERLKERRQRALRSRQARANPLASSRPVVEVYRNATDAVGERNVEQHDEEHAATDLKHGPPMTDQEIQPQATSSDDNGRDDTQQGSMSPSIATQDHAHAQADVQVEGARSEAGVPPTRPTEISIPVSDVLSSGLASPVSAAEIDINSELTIPEHKKNVWFKYLAEFWSKRTSSGWTSLEYPLHSTEHVFEDSDIIVREDEPSSIIALSLSCADYKSKVQGFRNNPKKNSKLSAQTHQQLDERVHENPQQKALEASLLGDTGTHMKYSFAHGQVKASCKIFYAEAFDALRRSCGVADRFMESLSRCLKFDSKGGKTKSLFLKTLDGRFYIKSLQEVELKAFTKFAPDYFAFMSHTLFHGVPSVIAKMFGLFQVTVKNPATGMDFSYYLLVMENLFYERTPSRRFDLKGSMRNRKVESTGQPDEVLLDENLVETIFESPLFVREHARKLLQASVWNDTMWLCKQNVMDYSLMAGFDDERKELVVGIIDCIRTYTWDKKLESWIKDRGKNKPTITSPKDYRNRFRVSMMQYVLQAPNCWHQFNTQMPMPKTLKERDHDREDETGVAETERPSEG